MSDAGDRGAAATLVVVSWNTRDLLDRCLRSLRADYESGLAEVVVVDNGSSDGSRETVRERHGWARLVEPDENLGFGRAVNLAAAGASTPWIACANADVELRRGALATLLEAGGRHPRAGAVAPRLVSPDGRLEHSVNSLPSLPFSLAYNLGLHRLWGRHGAERLLVPGHLDPSRAREVGWAVGAFLLIRREAFREAGGFDEEQWLYAEDLELGYRLRETGWSVRYEPAAEVLHVGNAAGEQAFGDAQLAHWLAATYSLLRRRRGRLRSAAVYALNTLGAGARWVLWTPLRSPEWRARRRHAGRVARWHLRRTGSPPKLESSLI